MRRRFYYYLLISLLLHLLILWFVQIPKFNPKELALSQPIWIDLKKGKYEVVDILPPAREEKPEESNLAGMFDSRVPKETVSTELLQRKTRDQGPGTQDQERKRISERSIVHSPLSLSPKSGPIQDTLLEDYLPDFRRGPHTYLNVLRFPDVQYFVMLKRVFKMTYDPLPSLQEAYFQNRITHGKVETVLGVSIDAQGQLAEVFIFRESGIQGFDQEAMRTIRASAPFMTPPAKLLDQAGLLRMTWTFTVYL